MIDVEPLINASFDRMLPERVPVSDWADVLERAGVRTKRLRGRSPRLVLALSVVALVIGAGAVAAAKEFPWWQSGAPPVNPSVVDQQLAPGSLEFPARADRSRARTVAEWNGATLVAAPLAKGAGYCLIPALPGAPDIGFSCEYQQSDEVRAYARPGGDARWIIWGRFTSARAATIDLTAAIGTPLKVTLQPGGFFIADLPVSRWSALNNGAGSANLLDASGNTIESTCLNFGPSPISPQAGQSAVPSPLTTSRQCVANLPIPDAPELARAKTLVDTTLVHDFALFKAGETVAIYEAPDAGSPWTCLFVETVPPRPLNGHPRGSEGCGANQTTTTYPLQVSYSYALSSGAYALVTGQVDPSLRATRVVVEFGNGGQTQLALANDHFIGEVHSSDAAPTADASVVAFGADGKEVARQNPHH